MSYVLTTSQFLSGLQQNSCKLLQSLRHITEVSPFTIADVRIQLELNQTQPFTDDAFRDFLTEIYNLEIDYTLLTATEITVMNVLREFISPLPSSACCGFDAPTLLNVTQVYNDRIGSATFEKEARFELDSSVTCDVFDILVAYGSGLSPVLSPSPIICNQLGCVDGKNVFSYLWIDFVSDPSGFLYDVEISLRDDTGGTIVTLITTHTF
jgi:hypothetical protein